jgi:MFS family permease
VRPLDEAPQAEFGLEALLGPLRDYAAHLRLFSRNARLYLLGAFFLGIGFGVFQLLLNLYFRELGFRETFIGSVLSRQSLGAMIIAVPAAILMSRASLKRILIFSTPLAVGGYALQAILVNPSWLLPASLLTGMVTTVYRVAGAPFFMRHSSPVERVYLFSMNFAVATAAGVVGSLGGGVLPALFARFVGPGALAYRLALLTGTAIAACAIVPFMLLRESEGATSDGGFHLPGPAERRLLLKLCIPGFIVGAGAGLIIPFLNLYFKSVFSAPTALIGAFFTVLQVAMTAGILAGPVLARRVGMIRSIVLTQLASMPFMLAMGFTRNLPAAVGCFLFRGALMNMGQPISTHYAMERVGPEAHAVTNSFLMLAWTSAWTFSAAAGGAIIERFGFRASFVLAVALYLVSTVLYQVFFGKEDRKPPARGKGPAGGA